MRPLRVGVLLGLAAAQTLVFVSPAHAASATSVTLSRGQLIVQAGTDVSNKISITERDGMVHVIDSAPVSPGEDCKRVNTSEVACPLTEIKSVFVGLGDGDDSAEVRIPVMAAIMAGPGNDQISGGAFDDTLSGGPGNDVMSGGAGGDTLYGGDGIDVMHGGLGDDNLQSGGGPDKVHGDDGNDTIEEPAASGPQANKLDGGWGDDLIIGSGNGMRDMSIYSWRLDPVGGNLSSLDYPNLPAGTGGQFGPTGELVEHDILIGLDGLIMGFGNDILIGHGQPIFTAGPGQNLCDPNGNDGIQLSPC
jgi:serralysin